MIVKNDAGEEIEVFTADEVAAKTAEVETAKQVEIDALAVDKAEKEEQLKKFQDKDYNFENLRKKADGKAGTEDELRQQVAQINERLNQVALQPVEDTKAEFIKTKVGEDKEKKDLFEYYFKRLGVEAKTKDEVLKAANEALVLATNGEYKPDGSSSMIGTGVNKNYMGTPSAETTEQSKEMGKLLGISEADRKKYGKKTL